MGVHDQRFKQAIQEFFPDLLRLMIPEWADAFDFDTVDWLQQEYHLDPPTGTNVLLDIVAKVEATRAIDDNAAGPWVATVNVEVEARDRAATLRRNIYEYWHTLQTRHQRPVLSLAVYMDVALAGLGMDVYTVSLMGQPQLTFRFPYLGLPGLQAFDYVDGDNLLAVAFSALMECPPERKAELKARALQRVATAPINHAQRFILAELIQAYLVMEEPQLSTFMHLLTTPPYQDARIMNKSMIEIGREEGEKIGEMRGEQRGAADTVYDAFELKFGSGHPEQKDRILQMNAQERRAFLAEILKAETLRDLGIED